MLRITVEIWPGGYERHKRVLASANVGNISSLADVSDYDVEISTAARMEPSWQSASEKSGFVRGHARLASVWSLVEKVAKLATEDT